MGDDDGGKIGGFGPVEIDETFIGDKLKNMHKSRRVKGLNYAAGGGKTIVMGMLERCGKVRAKIVKDRKMEAMRPAVHENVLPGATIITDEHSTYPFIAYKTYAHDVINHVEGYVRGHVHTNSIENFWSCLKRGLGGAYISVEPFHLDAYDAEQVFRFNHRKYNTDETRFAKVVSQVTGKRLTYAEVTGKVAETAF
jgi:hypothetical protein